MPERRSALCRAALLVAVLSSATVSACSRGPAGFVGADDDSGRITAAHALLTLDTVTALGRAGRDFPLAGEWRFRFGDDPAWSSPHTNDGGWALLDPGKWPHDSIFAAALQLETRGEPAIGWFRMRLTVDPALHGQALGIFFANMGAAEIYLDGRRIHSFGDVTAPGRRAFIRAGFFHPANTVVLNRTESLLAVRMNVLSVQGSMGRLGEGLFFAALEPPQTQAARIQRTSRENAGFILLCGTLAALAVMHLLLFALLRKHESNLYFGLFALLLAGGMCLSNIVPLVTDDARIFYRTIFWVVLPAQLLSIPALLAFLHSTFRGRLPRYFPAAFAGAALVLVAFTSRAAPINLAFILFATFVGVLIVDCLRITALAVWRRQPGARILGAGILVLGTAMGYSIIQTIASNGSSPWWTVVGFGALALAGSIHLAYRFALASRDLEQLTDHLEDEVRQRTHELEEATLAAESANRTKSQFLANMSHELRTPLNAIIGYSEMLVEEAQELGQEELVPDLRKIHTSGRHLLGLINDVLDLSKIEAGRMELFLERFDVADTVEDVATTIQPLIERNGNHLAVIVPSDVGIMRADEVKLRQILFNLLSNATKFTERGAITLSVRRHCDAAGADRLVFTVADTGIGMIPEQVDRLFQPFIQADASTTKRYGGTGLGLTITKRFAEMMGGTVSVQSAPGQGTTFSIDLPAEVTDASAAPAAPTQPAPAVEPGTERGVTILVIDDDASAREMISRVLVREGYGVVTAAGGDEGLKLAREIRPALITLDIMMRGTDGWSVLSKLKADAALAEIPVVIVTVVDDRNMGFALGATEYVTKPVDRDRLVSLLRRVLAHATPGPLLVVEDDSATRDMLRRLLEKEGWSVAEAGNGREALEAAAAAAPALVLLDLMMPEMDGFEFLREFRRRPATDHTPVVVLTAKDLTDEDRAMLQGAVTRVLQKGELSSDEIVQEVRRQLRAALPPVTAR